MRTGEVSSHGNDRHALQAGTHGDVDPAGLDLQGGEGYRLEAGRAETVDDRRGAGDRVTGHKLGYTGDVDSLLGFRECAAGETIVDERLVELDAIGGAGHGLGQKVLGPGLGKRPLSSSATGCSY
jgi:hypothetical protein